MAVDWQACWETLGCNNVLCPGHGQPRSKCWLIPRTHCAHDQVEDLSEKISSCLACAYFKARGGQHNMSNWNRFITDQLLSYNTNALERIYQKEESFIEILNRIPDGLFTTDKEWRITYFNPAAEKITGFSAYDAVGMYCKDVFKNAICESDCALKRAVAEGHDIHNREYAITNIDGKLIPIICSTSAFRDDTGQITGGLEIFKDISEIKRLQEKVLQREKRYRRIFEGSHDMIYTSNEAGDILDINPAGVATLGYTNKKEVVDGISAFRMYHNPKDRRKFISKINQEGFVKDYEVDFVRKDGTPIHVLISSRKHENPDTGSAEFEGIIKDITHRKETEEIIKKRNRELSILNSIAVAVNKTMDLDHVLDITLKEVLRVLRLNRGALFLIDRDKQKAWVQARSGLPVPDRHNRAVFKDGLLERHLLIKESLLTPKPTFPTFQASYRSNNGKNVPWLSCFLITFKGRGVGFFGLDISDDRRLNHHEIHLMGSLGNYLGGSVENAQLMKMVRQHRHELRHLTEKLFQSQEDERRRIARELHDEAGQSLTAIKLGMDRLEENHANGNAQLKQEIDEIRKMIKRTSSEIRHISYHLHPTLLIDLGLEPALKLYFKEIGTHSDLEIDFNMVGFDQRLDMDMETMFYRFSQEALTNALKHSGAEIFKLSLIKSYPCIIFLAEDDGMGFDPQIIGKDKRSLGLLGMRERAALLGGSMQLRSKLGEGTRIRIEIPHAGAPYDN